VHAAMTCRKRLALQLISQRVDHLQQHKQRSAQSSDSPNPLAGGSPPVPRHWTTTTNRPGPLARMDFLSSALGGRKCHRQRQHATAAEAGCAHPQYFMTLSLKQRSLLPPPHHHTCIPAPGSSTRSASSSSRSNTVGRLHQDMAEHQLAHGNRDTVLAAGPSTTCCCCCPRGNGSTLVSSGGPRLRALRAVDRPIPGASRHQSVDVCLTARRLMCRKGCTKLSSALAGTREGQASTATTRQLSAS